MKDPARNSGIILAAAVARVPISQFYSGFDSCHSAPCSSRVQRPLSCLCGTTAAARTIPLSRAGSFTQPTCAQTVSHYYPAR